MNFAFFLLLNAILLLRPEELFPNGPGLHLYQIAIVLCTATTLPRLIELLSLRSLRSRPIAVCVLLLLFSTFVSQLARGQVAQAFFDLGPEYCKLVLYYFLLIAIVDTRARFRTFIATLVFLILCLIAIALAQHYDMVSFPNIIPCVETVRDPLTGKDQNLPRLVSSGIFNDPNDLCLIVGLGIVSCIYCAVTTRAGVLGCIAWLLPIPLFGYALVETHSRGGMIGVLAGGAAYLYARFGGKLALPMVIVGGIGALALVGGRQASLEGGGTAHQRVMAWASGLTALYQDPLSMPFGLGIDWFVGETGLVAHNSFVQAYVELGVLGGGAFLGAFYLGVRILGRFGREIATPQWAIVARPFGIAAIVGYGVGCFSITRNFVVPTYLALGIVSVLVEQSRASLPERFQVTSKWLVWFSIFSICGLLFITIATQTMGRAGI